MYRQCHRLFLSLFIYTLWQTCETKSLTSEIASIDVCFVCFFTWLDTCCFSLLCDQRNLGLSVCPWSIDPTTKVVTQHAWKTKLVERLLICLALINIFENLVNNVKPLLYMLNTQKEGSDFVINSFLYCRLYARGCQRYGGSTSQSKLELQTSYFVFIDHGALSILMIVIFVCCFCSSNRKYEPLEGATVP